MSRLEEVQNEVNQKATTTVSAISSGYNEACQATVELFLNLINPLIAGMEKVMDFLDSIEQDIEAEYQKFEPFPDFPDFPELPSMEFEITMENVDCPLASCLGLPALPAMPSSIRAGYPDKPNPDDYPLGELDPDYIADLDAYNLSIVGVEGQIEEFDKAFKEYGEQFGTAIATNAEVGLKNAQELLENTPHYLLNGLIEAARATIAGLVDNEALDALEGILDCIEEQDPQFANAEEVVRFRALRSRIETDGDGQTKIPTSNAVNSVLGDFKAADINLKNKFAEANKLKKAGSGASKLTSSNPLEKFKKLI